ncbi:MAG: PHA/PHB synthase family protein [Rhodospirillaceae bacterium]
MDLDSQSAFTAYADIHRRLMEGIFQPFTHGGNTAWSAELLKAWNAELAHHATRWQEREQRYVREQLELWQRLIGASPSGHTQGPQLTDRRFRGEAWRHPFFAYLAQSYLLTQRWIEEIVNDAPVDEHAKRRLAFLARQYTDAISPANFAWSNPEALKRAIETRGESLVAGLGNMREDAERGRVSNVDRRAFRVGVNLAITPGAVVYENELIQLIQYRATTEQVYERPLVIVPPCINKYYILDLRPENSFVRYAVSRGHTVFVVSWRNVPPQLAHLTWDDYLTLGVMRAIEVARDICGVDEVNALGFCVGGTLLAGALAVMQARGERRVHSMTLLTTMLEYADTGELGVFIDEQYVAQRERQLIKGGLLRGEELALAFASLRANDLIWRYVVNNYLLGNRPEAFDLLYWNDDSANLPGPMYSYYLRNMYLENNLCKPCKLDMCGVPVDLGKLDMPAYAVAAQQDHIVPWKTAYASAALLGGKIEFVLTASGHVAGVVNPPPGKRRRYWSGGGLTADSDAWLAKAICHEGSWWPHWSRWLARQAGKRIAARAPGNPKYPEIEPAPGRYVTETAPVSRDEEQPTH